MATTNDKALIRNAQRTGSDVPWHKLSTDFLRGYRVDVDSFLMTNASCNMGIMGMPQKLGVMAMNAVCAYIDDGGKDWQGNDLTGDQYMTNAENAISQWEHSNG